MSNVFITHQMAEADYAGAAKWGTPVLLTQGQVDTTPRGVSTLVDTLLRGLKGSSPDDFLLPSGSSTVSALALLLWLFIHPRCKWLLFMGRKSGRYEVRTVTKDELHKAIAAAFPSETELLEAA